MIAPVTRKILLVGREISPELRGPLRYSGDTYRHPACDRTLGQLGALGAVFWIWIPADKLRRPWSGRSAVSPLFDLERAMLASGEIEELRLTVHVPVALDQRELTRWLGDLWISRCCRRWKCTPQELPEQFRDLGTPAVTAAGAEHAQEQRRIVLT